MLCLISTDKSDCSWVALEVEKRMKALWQRAKIHLERFSLEITEKSPKKDKPRTINSAMIQNLQMSHLIYQR